MKGDGSHVDFLGFAAQYLEVYVCTLVYLTYVATFSLIGEMFFCSSIEFSKLHVPGNKSCVIWYTFDVKAHAGVCLKG